MIIDIHGIHDFLFYITRLAEFKSKENYIPYLTFYKIKFNHSIENSINSYFNEDLKIEQKAVTFKQVTDELMQYIEYLALPKVQIGQYSGIDVLSEIKEEFNEITQMLTDLEWYLIRSEFMISFSVSGKVFVAQVDEEIFIFDFGFSD